MNGETPLLSARLLLVDAGVALVAYAALKGYTGGYWSPIYSSLSRLGVIPATSLLFNSGVALASVGLALYAMCSLLWLVAAAALSQVAVYTLAYPAPHFTAASIFFTATVAEVARRGGRGEAAAALAGYTMIVTGLTLHVPPGIALPEALVIAAALVHLHRRAYCGSYQGRRV